jgi:hypothetical protein
MLEGLSETSAVIKAAFLGEDKHLTYPFFRTKGIKMLVV